MGAPGMALAAADRGRLIELERALSNVHAPAHGPEAMQLLAELFDTEIVARWGFDRDRENLLLQDVATAGTQVPRRYFEELVDGVRAGETSFLFSAQMPERAQRNVPVLVHGARSALTLRRDEAARLGLTRAAHRRLLPGLERLIALHDRHHIAEHEQLRTLVCDGPLVLCYFNTLQRRPFTRRQKRVYRLAVELVRRRAVLDHRLASTNAFRTALDAALDAIGRAAFFLDAHGTIVGANALGLESLDRDRALLATLREAVRGHGSAFDVVPIREHGVPIRYLVVRRRADLADLAGVVAAELGLGTRARQILLAAITGEPTKSIAMRLDLATNTIEFHLTRIYRKLGVTSRSELQHVLFERLIHARHRGD